MPNYYPISKIIGNKITYYRKMKGMTLDNLANMVNVSQQQQSRYERGINRINVDRLYHYSKIFEIDIMAFFMFNSREINECRRKTFK
ncbi:MULTISPECIES: helix-turn-helix domain-containing protein [Providencia]|uniref:helix-turn-helix domain-containing protein n=1 Tax=Providencia TaxID=586 RepID=UPI00226F03A6|nr:MULTISPECIES: helix-turn-helix transcriptional regulator [Providencia]EJF7713491.1 helix-turn-helix transcriptional regulator [Providencia rettgeri]MCX9110401.1 helix-turn-helix domain-containing protein [Providencia rettgeri]MCX9116900.1 helix-turn-helix domain-containing protein [Providencia rettgeri]MDH2367229.1 helix-turn-helix transcriptional regulator [Providencia rettgeri]HEM7130676.1 helix-turn-helix transcriptional regulator [Providencia rettgeri]